MPDIIKIGFFFTLLGLLVGSCGINSHIMFKSPKGEYAVLDSLPLRYQDLDAYQIGVDDKITFSLSTNDGAKLVEGISSIGTGEAGTGGFSPEFVVGRDSTVELPVLGRVKMAGLTIPEAEDFLEKSFAKTYQNPFVQLKVTNQRVIVFPGEGGDAQVIALQNNNTTLMEVIAQAGGLPTRAKAKVVKLIRKEGDERKIYTIDLSTIDGLKYADVVVQSNDYVYIEPKAQLVRESLKELTPVLTILTSLIVITTTFLIN